MSNWIPVTEKLPRVREGQSKFVIVSTDGKYIYFARYFKSKKNGTAWYCENGRKLIVLAWQPMLEPYVENE